MRRLSLNRSEPAKKSGQNIPKNRCRTTIPERMAETRAELPFIGAPVGLSRAYHETRHPRKQSDSFSKVLRLGFVEIEDDRQVAALAEFRPQSLQHGDTTLGEPSEQQHALL